MTAARSTVIIVAFNAASRIVSCLESLTRQSLPAHEFTVWVVDNGSQDDTAELVTAHYPAIRLIRSPTNLGFAGGCNLALREVCTPTAVLLNDDAEASPEFLEKLLGALDADDATSVAAVTAKVLLRQKYELVDWNQQRRLPDGWKRSAGSVYAPSTSPAAVTLVNSTGTCVNRSGKAGDRSWLERADQPEPSTEVFGFYGGAAALRMSALREVGLFDERYFLYYEDTDLSWRLRRAGWTIRFVPGAVAIHRHAASTEGRDAVRIYFELRNALLTFTKHAPLSVLLWALVCRAVEVPARAALELPDVRPTFTRIRAWAAFLRLAPTAVCSRRRWRDSGLHRPDVATLPGRRVTRCPAACDRTPSASHEPSTRRGP